jgi:hypothetical protein
LRHTRDSPVPQALPTSNGSKHESAAVEFALVLPLLLTVALALVEVSLLVRDRLLVEAVTRAGTRGRYRPLANYPLNDALAAEYRRCHAEGASSR